MNMQQYIIYGWDGTDENALERRMAARPSHLEHSRNWKASGNFITGGAVLDDADKMIGSTMIMQFDSRETLDTWLNADPYVTQKVWQKIDIRPFKVADV
jgi:uncharacterized protein YciI